MAIKKLRVLVLLSIAFALTVSASDWPSWRGPAQNGTSSETGLISTWSQADETNLIWKAPFIGRSTPVVMNGRVYVIGRIGDGITMQEHVACFDAKSGKLIWQNRFNVYLTTVPFNRVGWASLAGDPETGNVYAHGVGGLLICFNTDGKILWSHSLAEDYGQLSGYGGRTDTPIVDENVVIQGFSNVAWGEMSPPRNRYYAFDKRTGDLVWIATPGITTPYDLSSYSTPVVSVINGQRLLIAGNGDGNIYAMQARTGQKVWGFGLSKRGINAAVVVDGNHVFAAHSEENLDEATMGRIVCIDGSGTGDITKTGEVWRAKGIESGYSSPAFHDGRLYVVDNSANLFALNGADGASLWKHNFGTVGKGSPVIADGKIYLTEENGTFHILQPTATDCKDLHTETFKMPTEGGRYAEVYGSPAIAYGRIYVETEEGLYCLGEKHGKFKVEPPVAAKTVEETPAPDTAVALVQVAPAEVQITPQDTAQFHVRLFDNKGRFLREEKASWTPTGLKGVVDAAGKFTPDATAGSQAGTLTAKVGELEGKARVRIVAALPWKQDFEAITTDKPPAYWIGVGTRFQIKDLNGNKVLTKPISQAGLSNADIYLGPSTMDHFEIQADLMGTQAKRRMPDLGLIAQGYTLDLMGNHQKLQLRSWNSMLRVKQELDFPWKPDVWYTMKLRVDMDGGRGIIHGKVWPKDDKEPQDWTITAEDPLPIVHGSPGLYGNSTADLYFDNLQVTSTAN